MIKHDKRVDSGILYLVPTAGDIAISNCRNKNIPVISVYMPVYNHKDFIKQAIDGVLAQKTDFPVRLVISDDASDDGTAEICRHYYDMYPEKIELIQATRNTKMKIARVLYKRCVQSGSKYVALCEGDDYWTDPLKLQKQFNFMESHPECAGCCHDVSVVDEDGLVLMGSCKERPYFRIVVGDDGFIKEEGLVASEFRTQVPTCSFFFINKVFESMLSRFDITGDIHLIFCTLSLGKFFFIDEKMGSYRQHPGGWTFAPAEVKYMSHLQRYISFLCDDELRRKYIQSIDAGLQNIVRMFSCLSADSVAQMRKRLIEDALESLRIKQNEWKRENKRVAVVGAGKHTEFLFKNTGILNLNIVSVLDEKPSLNSFYGIETRTMEDIDKIDCDVFIISSTLFQETLAQKVRKHIKNSQELFTFYPPDKLDLAAKEMPVYRFENPVQALKVDVKRLIGKHREGLNMGMTFAARLLDIIEAAAGNDLKGNYDIFRYKYEEPAGLSDAQLTVAIDKFSAYFPSLQFSYDILKDAESRELLMQIVAYRIMGHRKIRLPVNWKQFRRAMTEFSGMADYNDNLWVNAGGRFLPLPKLSVTDKDGSFNVFCSLSGAVAEFNLGQYRFQRNGIRIAPEKADIVLDCGACWGEASILFSREVGDGGHVYSFEFMPENIKVFNANVALHEEYSRRITLIPFAVGKACETLYRNNDGPGTKCVGTKGQDFTEEVNAVSIDGFVEKQKISKVDFIKMDIEGSEMGALHGAENVIRKYRPRMALSVYHRIEDFWEIPRFINGLGLGYEFYLGHYTINKEETVLYARSSSR